MEIMRCKLPEDLEIGILSRLPVKSLLRFKCVCKSWYVLIKSPRFINKHLHLSQTSSRYIYNDSYLLVLCSYEGIFNYFATILSSETLGVSREVESLNLIDSLIVGSCNGLVCIFDNNCNTVRIYNPATREVKSLPIPPYLAGQPHVTSQTRYLGFGFDPKMNDYKVVRIVELECKETLRRLPSVVQICMLRSGSWRDTELVLPARIFGYSWLNTYINGTFNWLACNSFESFNEFMILSFHMSDEVFETIKIPSFLVEGHHVSLALWNGSFALIRSPFKRRGRPPSTPTYFEIWVMNQSRLEEAWVKQVALGPIAGVERPVAILGIDKLFLESDEGELISCDLRTQEIRNHQIYGNINSMQVGIYNESLTSVE